VRAQESRSRVFTYQRGRRAHALRELQSLEERPCLILSYIPDCSKVKSHPDAPVLILPSQSNPSSWHGAGVGTDRLDSGLGLSYSPAVRYIKAPSLLISVGAFGHGGGELTDAL